MLEYVGTTCVMTTPSASFPAAEIKASVPKLIFTDTGLIGWNHLKVREMQSLSEAINTFLQTLLKDFPDDRTENFAKIVISEMEQISKPGPIWAVKHMRDWRTRSVFTGA